MLRGRGSLVRRAFTPESWLPTRFAPVRQSILDQKRQAALSTSARQLTTSIDHGEDAVLEGTKSARPARQKKVRRRIRTLDPSRLAPADHLDFSSLNRPTLRAILHPEDSPSFFWQTHSGVARGSNFVSEGWSSRKFPPGTHGFLYYHIPPQCPPLAGELRFRITSSSDPATFSTGSDLLTERGMPWRYPLYKMVERDCFRDLVTLLLQDGLVSRNTTELATSEAAKLHLLRKTEASVALGSPSTAMLGAFGQEFELRLEENCCTFIFAGADSLRKIFAYYLTGSTVRTPAGLRVCYNPLEGSVVCCFERSTLPEHEGKRIVAIRVKRFVDSRPIRHVPPPDGREYPIEQLKPREGGLLKVMYHGKPRPWALDVDERKGDSSFGKSLKILFENEELYGPLWE